MMRDAVSPAALLDDKGVREADAGAVAAGVPLTDLIARAGRAVADVAQEELTGKARIAVWAGPGMNGEDARVAAGLLGHHHQVELYTLATLDEFSPDRYDLVIDGLFGTGLDRPLDTRCAQAVERLAAGASPVLSIDIPSGIHAGTGAVMGSAVRAWKTVTFERRRAGHLLMPGRTYSGTVVVADIGIPSGVWVQCEPVAYANEPALWIDRLHQPSTAGHKYDRGHAVVFAGPLQKSGAARLSALGALRGGAGLVTLAAPPADLAGLSAHVTAIMLRGCADADDLAALLQDARFNAFVLGPGFGDLEKARIFAEHLITADRALVLDADAISAFGQEPQALFALFGRASGNVVLTPHGGEFKRLFPDLGGEAAPPRLEAARTAAARAGAVVVLKGADTVIAAPDGRAAINASGTPWLATAGTGDVLTGIIAAQLAQGTPVFEAACAGVWMHGRAAEAFGPGLVSEDLPSMLPRVHAELVSLRDA